MRSAYLNDIMEDPILRRIFEAQQPQAQAAPPAEIGGIETHPALPEEPVAPPPETMMAPVRQPPPETMMAPVRQPPPELRGTDVGGGWGTSVQPPAIQTVPQQGPAADRSGPAMPPEPIPAPPIQADPQTLAMMQRDEPGPQVTGMAKEIDAPGFGSVLLTGQDAANHIPDKPKPSYWSKLKAALPEMAQRAIAAGATPSHYGGGPLDIFQGMQAGQAAVDHQHDRITAQDRQKRLEDLNTAKVRADIKQSEASARHSDASAEWAKAQATQKAVVSAAEKEYAEMNKYPIGSEQWKQHHDLWQEALHGKSASADKVWYEVKGMPGMERNSVTGEYREAVKGAGIPMRIEEIRQGIKGYNPKIPWTDSEVRQQATEAQRIYIATGKWPSTPAERNPTPASIAKDAFDPTLSPEERAANRQALTALHPGPAPPDPAVAEARQARMDKARADQFDKIEATKGKDLEAAQQYQDMALKALATERKLDVTEVAKLPEGQAIYKTARRKVQDAHNRYTASIRRATGDPQSAEDWVVLPSGEAIRKSMADSLGLKQGPDGEFIPPKANDYDADLKRRKAARDYTPPPKADKR